MSRWAEKLTRKRSQGVLARENLVNFSFILPALVIFVIFYVFPFWEIARLSLQDWNGISLTRRWVGLSNFLELAQDRIWWSSVWHAAYVTLIALTFQNAFAFALALACDREIRLKRFYRLVFFIPPILSEIVVGLIFLWILHPGMQNGQYIGLLNNWLYKAGLTPLVHHWLSDPKTALTCIAIVHSWKGFGWGFIMLLAGLQMVDRQLYEAAKVDGAGAWDRFWNITIPLMMPVIVVVMILTILGSMQVFVLIIAMVGDGLGYHTQVPVTRILSAMQETNRFGYACAMGVTFGLILIGISVLTKIFSNKVHQT